MTSKTTITIRKVFANSGAAGYEQTVTGTPRELAVAVAFAQQGILSGSIESYTVAAA